MPPFSVKIDDPGAALLEALATGGRVHVVTTPVFELAKALLLRHDFFLSKYNPDYAARVVLDAAEALHGVAASRGHRVEVGPDHPRYAEVAARVAGAEGSGSA